MTISGFPPSDAPDADVALLPLMLWLSPAFPVGSFAYSQGLEWAVESADIHDARSLGGWLVDLLEFGPPRSDALLFADCISRGRGGRLGSPRGGKRGRHRARQFCRTSPGDHVSGRRLCRRRSRRMGLRSSASAFAGGARRLSRGRRLGCGGSRVAARGEPSGLHLGPNRRRRLCCRAPRPDRPDRRSEDPGDAHPPHTRACP